MATNSTGLDMAPLLWFVDTAKKIADPDVRGAAEKVESFVNGDSNTRYDAQQRFNWRQSEQNPPIIIVNNTQHSPPSVININNNAFANTSTAGTSEKKKTDQERDLAMAIFACVSLIAAIFCTGYLFAKDQHTVLFKNARCLHQFTNIKEIQTSIKYVQKWVKFEKKIYKNTLLVNRLCVVGLITSLTFLAFGAVFGILFMKIAALAIITISGAVKAFHYGMHWSDKKELEVAQKAALLELNKLLEYIKKHTSENELKEMRALGTWDNC